MQTHPISNTGKAIRIMTLAAVATDQGYYDVGRYDRVASWALWRYRQHPRKSLDKSLAADVLNGVIRARL